MKPEAEKWFKEFLERADREMFPKMRDSAMSLSIFTSKTNKGKLKVDAKLAVEVGAAILLDKPLIFFVERGTRLPTRMLMIADEVVEFDDIRDPAMQQELQEALKRVAEKVRKDDESKDQD